jgi:Domain of unknown function (DUF4062)
MRIFLSSTYEDLIDHRQSVELSLSMSDIPYNAMEHFGSSSTPPVKTCLDAVKASDVFVGIIGVRYGSSPANGVLSYTEREYRTAKKLAIPILMFLIDMTNAFIPARFLNSETPDRQARLARLKNQIQRERTVTFFTTPDNLTCIVLASLIREFGVI